MSSPDGTTGPNKGKGKAAQGRKPYPASRPLGPSARLNKKGTPSARSNSESDEASNEGTTLAAPPMTRTSTSSSSSYSVKTDRSPVDLGMPSREEFAAMEEQYIVSLDPRKQAKALISQTMFDSIWLTLHKPRDNTIGSPQFRWWVRKMFVLARPDEFGALVPFVPDNDTEHGSMSFVEYGRTEMAEIQEAMVMTGAPYLDAALPLPVVLHDGKRVAIREQIYDILCVCHERVRHGGRDKTATEIRRTYTWVPKDLIALFVKNCPTCQCKRSKLVERAVDNGPSPEAPSAGSPMSEEESQVAPVAQYVPLPMSNVICDSQATFPHVPSLGLPAWSDSPHSAPPPPNGVAVHDLSDSPPWYFPPGAAIPSGGPAGYFFLPNGMYAAPLLQPHGSLDSVQLPSIRVTDTDTDADGPGALPHHPHPHAKVTLPSLSQVLSGELTAAGRGLSRIRQPLQALPGNGSGNYNGGFDPLQPGSSPLRGGSPVGYVPVIDPALLAQDGVHMLAMAAEAVQRGR